MTFNQQFYDASIRHQIDLLRYGAGVSRKVNAILDETKADLRKQVERRLGKTTGFDSDSVRRLAELERAIDQQRSAAWNDVNDQWKRTALDVALEEPLFVAGTLTSILPVELDLVMPSDGTLRALATTRPFQGKNLKEWADSASRSDLARIHQQIRIGMVQGESSRDIANRVFGARGAMSITANQADAVTRTVISHVSNVAQQEFLSENSDLFDVEQLVATLDARTTPICRALDGHQYPIGKGPIPPLHVRCRSLRVAVIDGEAVGERPFKAGTEEQMLREYGEKHGLGAVKSRDDLPKGHKRSFDEFSRKRMRELTGQVPAHTTYQQWLSGQSAAFQDDVLGPARGALFRDGGLKLDQFVNRQGDELTLDELRARNREAWNASGLGSGKPHAAPPPDPEAERAAAERARQKELEAARERAAEAERQRKAEEDRARQAELESLKAAFDEAERERARLAAERLRRESAAEQKLAQHVDSFSTVGDVEPKFKQIAANVINKVRPKATKNLGSLEIVKAKNVEIDAFGTKVKAAGYYTPGKANMVLSTDRTFQGLEVADTNFSTGSAASSPEEAFGRLVAHEYGHHIHISAVDFPEVDETIRRVYRETVPMGLSRSATNPLPTNDTPPEGAPSRYGTADRYEFWAESFTAYHFDRAWLKQTKPDAFGMVESVLNLLNR